MGLKANNLILLNDGKDDGWVKVYRKMLDNPIFKDSETLQLFLYCLLRANFKPNDFLFNGQVVHLERGQFIFGLRKASKALKMSIRKLRTRLLVLGKLGITTQQTTHRFSIITVCNYNYYQDSENEKGHNKGHTDDTLTTTNKNVKKEKNKEYVLSSRKKLDLPPFEEIINYLNQKTGKNFSFKTKTYQRTIKARWKEGKKFNDFKKVIDIKFSKWATDEKMMDFLRPETLFGPKMDSYLNEKVEADPYKDFQVLGEKEGKNNYSG